MARVEFDQPQLALGHLLQAGAACDIAHFGAQVVVLALGGGQLGVGLIDLTAQLGELGVAVQHADDQPQHNGKGQRAQRGLRKTARAVQPAVAAAHHFYLRARGL